MDNLPTVSIYGPSVNMHFWLDLYNQFCKNSISFEIVFCGPCKPPINFPPNFRYIKSNVKPSQCAEIARRNCRGEFLMVSSDDIVPNAGFLDNMHKTYLAAENENCVVSCRLGKNQRKMDKSNASYRYFYQQVESPHLALCPFIKREVVDEIQGIDRNFIALAWDADITLRVVERGGFVKFCDTAYVYERHKPKDRLSGRHGEQDRMTLDRLWCLDSTLARNTPSSFHPFVYNNLMISKTRLRAVDPFSSKRITQKSQGRRHSDWK